MERYYSSAAVRNADVRAAEECGVPGIVLMENAGRGAADIVRRLYPDASDILILCGPGNNGGDGFVLARHLKLGGLRPSVIATVGPESYRGDAALAREMAERCGVDITESTGMDEKALEAALRAPDLLVDALLGTGSGGVPRGEVRRLLSACRRLGDIPRVVSLDIPSGIDPDTGEIAEIECAAEAETTITFLARKAGLAVTPGALKSGRIEVADIGVPVPLVLDDTPALTGYGRGDIPALLPALSRDAHKGSRGGLLVIGGSAAFRGAPVLAARGALRSGCGLVVLAVPDFMVPEASALLPEAVFAPLRSAGGTICPVCPVCPACPDDLEMCLSQWMSRVGAVVVGPGLGRDGDTERVVEIALGIGEKYGKPILIDADGLYHLASLADAPSCSHLTFGRILVTPHPGEAARLLGTSTGSVAVERLASCAALAGKFGNVLLKGYRTLVADRSGRRVILEGNEALSVPGSGDVLSGAIGAFMASGMPIIDAATLGALVHGVSGEISGTKSGLLAREIADGIPLAVNGGL